jgi:8-oxo-dGTP pyrophosphatase MutT (NUDIX family)
VNNVRLAATLMLARPAQSGFELYMTRRNAASAFAADAFVFPGGTLEPQDSSQEAQVQTLGLEPARLRGIFRARVVASLPSTEAAIDETSGSALLIAGLRELFEEAGILIAREADGQSVAAVQAHSPEVVAERKRVRDGSLAFGEFLRSHDWHADAAALALFSHWITPPSEPRRYNTHFFFAVAPPDQVADPDAVETHDGMWISPTAVLERYRAGQLHLVYPTIKHLERLATVGTLDEALAFARTKPVITIMPAPAGESFRIPEELEGAW